MACFRRKEAERHEGAGKDEFVTRDSDRARTRVTERLPQMGVGVRIIRYGFRSMER